MAEQIFEDPNIRPSPSILQTPIMIILKFLLHRRRPVYLHLMICRVSFV